MATGGRGFRAAVVAASLIAFAVFLAGRNAAAEDTLFVSKRITPQGEYTAGIEGPAVDASGNLYVVNFQQNGNIGKLAAGASQSQLFTSLPAGSIGNGIRFDRQGRMYVADFKKHNVWVIERGETTPHLYFHSDRFNQPNDLAIAADGTLYASDPRFASPAGGQIWRITRGADGKGQGEVMSSTRRLGVTNGIDLSPDGATLYVSEFEFAAGLGLSPRRQQAARPAAGQGLCGFRGRRPAHRRRRPDLSRAAFGRQDRHYRGQWIARTRGTPERKAADQPHLWRPGRQNRVRDPEGRPLHRGFSCWPSRPRALPAGVRHVLKASNAKRPPYSTDLTGLAGRSESKRSSILAADVTTTACCKSFSTRSLPAAT